MNTDALYLPTHRGGDLVWEHSTARRNVRATLESLDPVEAARVRAEFMAILVQNPNLRQMIGWGVRGAAFKTFADNQVLFGADVMTYLMNQVIDVCTAGTRPGSPANGQVIYQTDTTNFWVYNGTSWVQLSPFKVLLASTIYNPATDTTRAAGATTFADVDSTNLSITFTVPPNGRVLVELNATFLVQSVGANSAETYFWNLRDTLGNQIGNTSAFVCQAYASADIVQAVSCAVRRYNLTGLSAGSSLTYRWGHRVGSTAGTGVGEMLIGAQSEGEASMWVWGVNP